MLADTAVYCSGADLSVPVYEYEVFLSLIHILEKLDLAGGSCDGRKDITKGYYMRGGREMDNHFEVMWDVYRDVPSIETPGVTVLDEYYW